MLEVQDNYLIVSVLENFLGAAKFGRNTENRTQWEFNCPSKTCRHDHAKFNLAYNSEHKIYKCWKCKISGYVHKLVREYGQRDDIKRINLILPEYKRQSFSVFKKNEIDYDLVTCELPEGFYPLSQERQSKLYRLAYNYAVSTRKISLQQIDKYKIGYTERGSRKFRLIIPSFNSSGKMNYYEARTFLDDAKRSYMKPDFPDKNDIIFNEQFINWDLPIYLVEGVFDAIRLPNAIPMLGKTPSDLLFNKILEHNSTVIVCLDSDACKDAMEIYKRLSSLGINVYFIDLKGKKDISKIFEDGGQNKVNEVLKTIRRIDTMFEVNKLLNE